MLSSSHKKTYGWWLQEIGQDLMGWRLGRSGGSNFSTMGAMLQPFRIYGPPAFRNYLDKVKLSLI
jgi:hypothetical protein